MRMQVFLGEEPPRIGLFLLLFCLAVCLQNKASVARDRVDPILLAEVTKADDLQRKRWRHRIRHGECFPLRKRAVCAESTRTRRIRAFQAYQGGKPWQMHFKDGIRLVNWTTFGATLIIYSNGFLGRGRVGWRGSSQHLMRRPL